MRVVLGLLVACLLTSCAETRLTGAGNTTLYEPKDLLAPADKARIVFIQNHKEDKKVVFTVFGSDRRCVAQVGGRQAQILDVYPGPYVFYISAYEQTRRIEVYPEAGRTYFIRLHIQKKPVGSVGVVTPVRRTSKEHGLLRFHLDGASVLYAVDNEECFAVPLKERESRTNRRLNEANADWKNGDDVYRDTYTLIEGDGLTHEDISVF